MLGFTLVPPQHKAGGDVGPQPCLTRPQGLGGPRGVFYLGFVGLRPKTFQSTWVGGGGFISEEEERKGRNWAVDTLLAWGSGVL